MTNFEFLTYRVESGVAFVTLNRPEVLNSFNERMGQEFLTVLGMIENGNDVRAVHLTGAGRAFCAGQDLADVLAREGKPTPNLESIVTSRYNPIVRAIRRIEKPFVCAVNGVAAGAGANLALSCDLTIASRKASFVQSFCKIGLVPDTGGTFILPRLVGLQRAAAQMLLGEKITADIAAELGMILRSVDPDSLLRDSTELAKNLATQPTKGLGLTKRALNMSIENSFDEQLDLEARLQGEAGATHDYSEGVAAFIEKREPVFLGK